MATRRKPGGGKEIIESMYSVIALVFLLVACVELCDAATVVDVYRLIQYDIAGAPFGSRLASLNHLASSERLTSDLSRSALVLSLPLASDLLKEYVDKGKQLGGLLLLLPQMLNPVGGDGEYSDKEKEVILGIGAAVCAL